MTVNNIICLLEFCLKNTYFLFQGGYYEQIEGDAMGSPISPRVANLYMEKFEIKALNTAPHSICHNWHNISQIANTQHLSTQLLLHFATKLSGHNICHSGIPSITFWHNIFHTHLWHNICYCMYHLPSMTHEFLKELWDTPAPIHLRCWK